MAFPSSKTLLTDPQGTSLLTSPDHAGLHTSVNDLLEQMQDTYGTTAGTNILRDMQAGDKPARINASNVLQQVITGTVNTTVGTLAGAVIGTPAVSAGTWSNAQLIGTPQITGGTVANALVGTSQHTGGTVTAVVMTASNISGGTVTATELKSGTATVNISSSSEPSSGQTLIATGVTTATWQTPSSITSTSLARAYRTNAQAISPSTITKLQLNTESFDPGGNFDSDTNYRYTVPTGGGGYYYIHGQSVIAGIATAKQVYLYIYKNNSTIASMIHYNTTAGASPTVMVSTIGSLAATDYIELFIKQSDTGTLNASEGSDTTFLEINRISK